MSSNTFLSRISDKVGAFPQALGKVIAFVPWLIAVYILIAVYVVKLSENDREVIQGFVEWFGTAYSFFLALAIVNVWSQFETVERELDRELDAIASLLQAVNYTVPSEKSKKKKLAKFKNEVRADIKKYLEHVLEHHKYEHLDPEKRRTGTRILRDVGDNISKLVNEQIVAEPFINQLFRSLYEAIDVRGDRISHSKPYTPGIIQFMAVVISLIWLLSFLGLVIFDQGLTLFIRGSVGFVIMMVLVIFFDLGDPFGGIWKINLEDWREFLTSWDQQNDP